MVSFKNFAFCLIVCFLTGSTSESVLENLKPKENTQERTNAKEEGAAAQDATNEAPAIGNLPTNFPG